MLEKFVVREEEVPLHVSVETGKVMPGVCKMLISAKTGVEAEHMNLGSYRLEAGQTCGPEGPHVLEKAEAITFIISGRGIYELGDKKIEVGPGMAVYCPPKVPHRVIAKEPMYFIFVFSPPII